VRRTVPPSAEIEEQIDELLAVGVGENPRESLSGLATGAGTSLAPAETPGSSRKQERLSRGRRRSWCAPLRIGSLLAQ
jgi:hypothetical protein